MKKTILILGLVFGISYMTAAQQADLKAVKTTLSYYLDGGTNNDFETLKKAFHKNASMKYIANEYKEVNAIDFFKRVMKPGPKQNRETKIVSVDIIGNTATAKLEINYPTFTFHDNMQLLKFGDEWKIVNKMFYREKGK